MSENRTSKRVKLNYCGLEELMTLEGIGRERAQSIVECREKSGPYLSVEDLENVPKLNRNLVTKLKGFLDWSFNGYFISEPRFIEADAREIHRLLRTKVDLIITSPPYWQKRDYNHQCQIGQEDSPEAYVQSLCAIVDSWIPLLHPHSTVCLNVGDTFRDNTLLGIPSLIEITLKRSGWFLVNKIMWSKQNGVPEPLQYRLANRHEVILQFARSQDFFSDASALAGYLNQDSNPGDVWNIPHGRNKTDHLAPFPSELVRRLVHFACPEHVCNICHKPFTRKLEPSFELDMSRPQAKRAIELFEMAGLTDAHLKAIRAVGISDAGKGQKVQTGAGSNAKKTAELAYEAKVALGGYFREFTFSRKITVGWDKCQCHLDTRPGVVLDPFMGSGTTALVANQLGRIAIGSDLVLPRTLVSKS